MTAANFDEGQVCNTALAISAGGAAEAESLGFILGGVVVSAVPLPEVVLSTAGLATLIYRSIRIGAGGSDISVITGLFAAVVLLRLLIALQVRSRPGWSSRTAGVRHQDGGLTAMTGNSSS